MSVWSMESLLRDMCVRQASDLLLTAGAPPQFRVNGYLEEAGTERLDPRSTLSLAHSVLEPRQIDVLTQRRSLDFSRGIEGLSRFRFNVYFQRNAIAVAVRRVPFTLPRAEQLGLPDIVWDFASRPHGLVLITGPAGSGKSTTLAMMIDHINRTRRVHVVCIEDPIEYLHTHELSVIDQREVGEDALTLDDALRSVFRQSPDVIMVGEMRDLETVQLAINLAETGHLILATLHTQDAVHAINRVVDAFPGAQQQQIYTQLSLVLEGVVAQQLLPRRDGKGRVLAYEVMNVNNAIRNLIREAEVQQIYSVFQTGRAENMVTMNDSLKALCEAGAINSETALRRAPRPKELVRLLETQVRQ